MRIRKNVSHSASAVEVIERLRGLPYGMTLKVNGIRVDPLQIANLPDYTSVPEVNFPTLEIFKAAKANKLLDLVVTNTGFVYVTSNFDLEPFEAQVKTDIGSILTSA